MGSQSGGGYHGSPASFQALKNNIDQLSRKYPLDIDKRFGTKISDRISEVRSDTPLQTAEEFWTALSQGATIRQIQTKYGPGWIGEFSDRSHVVWRPMTSSAEKTGADNPAVDIDIKTSGHGFPPRYRIHFRKGRSK